MKIKRSTTLYYIVSGKEHINKIIFAGYYYKIPVYYSNDIRKINVLKLVDDEILIIENKHYIDQLSSTEVNIEVCHKILDIIYKSKAFSDACCASWISLVDTINYIKNSDKNNCSKRISNIEALYKSGFNKIPNFDYIINQVKHVSIED